MNDRPTGTYRVTYFDYEQDSEVNDEFQHCQSDNDAHDWAYTISDKSYHRLEKEIAYTGDVTKANFTRWVKI